MVTKWDGVHVERTESSVVVANRVGVHARNLETENQFIQSVGERPKPVSRIRKERNTIMCRL